MGYEIVRTKDKPCWCGKSTITYTMEMDDWNRTRHERIINCSKCAEKDRKEREQHEAAKKKNEALYEEAKERAIRLYLKQWQNLYTDLSKKEAWQKLTSGKGYPSLGTFYKHVKHAGSVNKYVTWCFLSDFEDALLKMEVKDKTIQNLLSQRSKK